MSSGPMAVLAGWSFIRALAALRRLLLRKRRHAHRWKLLIERRQHIGRHIDRIVVGHGAVLRQDNRGAAGRADLLDDGDEPAADLLLHVRGGGFERTLAGCELLLRGLLFRLEGLDP